MPTPTLVSHVQAMLKSIGLAARGGRLPGGKSRRQIVGMDKIWPVKAPASQTYARLIISDADIIIINITLGVCRPDQLGHGVGQRAEAFFAGTQRVFCLFTFSDIDQGDDDAINQVVQRTIRKEAQNIPTPIVPLHHLLPLFCSSADLGCQF